MEEILADISQRGDTYKFLADCYYLPDEELMQKVADFAQSEVFFAELVAHIPPAVDLENLKVDYSKLFVGPYKLLAAPYGSVYLEDNKLMGRSTVDVKNCYEDEGLDIVIKDAPDHIAMELEFLYYLITKQACAIEGSEHQLARSYQKKQSAFLDTHLGRWVDLFAENVQKNAQTDFYRTLGRLTELFVVNEKNSYV